MRALSNRKRKYMDARYILDFGGTEVFGVNLDNNLAGLCVDTLLLLAFTSPPAAQIGKCLPDC
jgi:hypothetical protein